MSDELHRLAADYLARLQRAGRCLDEDRLRDLLVEIEGHLREAIPVGASDDEALKAIERLGPPGDIVEAEQPIGPTPVNATEGRSSLETGIALPVATGRREMRASDADRTKIAGRLQRAADEGRLTAAECRERLDRAVRARTYRELEIIVADLPLGRSWWTRRHRAAGMLRRPSDADRALTAERLRDAAGEGRLSLEEFDARLGHALVAPTYQSLDAIVADLPRRRILAVGPSRLTVALRRAGPVKRAARLRNSLWRRPGRALIAGALATAALAVPLIAVVVPASGPPTSPRPASSRDQARVRQLLQVAAPGAPVQDVLVMVKRQSRRVR